MLERVRRFWTQPTRRYRDFQLVYSAITLNFAIPAATYYLDPQATIERAERIGRLLGGGDLPATEDSKIWWVLGAGNVATLAFMCATLQRDLRRYRPVLGSLVFLKLCSAAGYANVYRQTRHPFFAGATGLDLATAAAMWFFAKRAYDELVEADAESAGAAAVVDGTPARQTSPAPV
ncbi:MAG: hypothetical protein K1X95_09690 [Acidimicrobiia bacterium]|nr:hypothetical protein [Acidimicrobiia bacterium]